MKLTIDNSSTLQHLVINQLLLKQQIHPLVNTVCFIVSMYTIPYTIEKGGPFSMIILSYLAIHKVCTVL